MLKHNSSLLGYASIQMRLTKGSIHTQSLLSAQRDGGRSNNVEGRLRRILSRSHLIPRLPVPHFLSPWTNDPHKINPHGEKVPIKFGPMDKLSP